jgi:hypothetical protein
VSAKAHGTTIIASSVIHRMGASLQEASRVLRGRRSPAQNDRSREDA